MRLSQTFALAAGASAWLVAAADNCGWNGHDLSPLKGTKTATLDIGSEPHTVRRIVRLNVCDVLGKDDKIPDEDQCDGDVHACLQVVSVKKGQDDRYIRAVPLWDKSASPEVHGEGDDEWQFRIKASQKYAGAEQHLIINMICDPDAGNDQEPTFKSYIESNDEAKYELKWRSAAACKRDSDDDSTPDGDKSSGGGFFHTLGVIFWFIVFAFLAYFVLGALYNYHNYGARGSDLIPHRDFWREVPALAQDLGSHLFNNVRQSSSRGGYSSLG